MHAPLTYSTSNTSAFDEVDDLKLPIMTTAMSETSAESPVYSRKEKSLGQLCKKFLMRYANFDEEIINLEKSSSDLNVEKRRIYDIINILECFNVLER